MRRGVVLLAAVGCLGCSPRYDIVIRHGTVYDGSGAPPVAGDVAITGDTIVAVGTIPAVRGRLEIEARGLAVAPGFINMLSHAEVTLIHDPRGQSDIRQGVTLEVLGEGSMGPMTEAMKRRELAQQGVIKYDITWRTPT